MNKKLYLNIVKQSLTEFLTYRMTSILVIIFSFLFTGIELIAGKIYYSFGENLAGFTYQQYELMILVVSSLTYTYQFLFVAAHESLADDIISGNMDYSYIRPVNSYFYYALRKLDFPSGCNLLVYLSVTVYLLIKFNLSISAWFAFILFYIVGTLLIFFLNQIIVEISFWKDNLSALNGVPEYLVDSASRPSKIYPKYIRTFLTNIIPVLGLSNGAIMLTMNSKSWFSNFSMFFVPMLVVTIILFILSYFLWGKGTKRYVSAN